MRRRYGKDDVTGEKNVLLWVAPGAVRYDQEDMEFLLLWLDELEEGVGPAEPENGYIGGGKKTGYKDFANYEAWCKVAAEINNRLAMTWPDHHLLREYYRRYEPFKDDRDIIEDIGRANNLPACEVTRRINSVKSYISSGDCRRWIECSLCPKFDKCNKNKKLKHNIYTYQQWVRSRSRYRAAERK
jgi:hypothetical protein